MWIFCGGMQRSASTLQYQMASAIVEEYGRGYRITWYSTEGHKNAIDQNNPNHGYKVFKSHVFTNQIKEQFVNNNALGLYIFRDIRDVISSLKEKNSCDYSEAQIVTIVKRLVEQHALWISAPSTYISKYEDVIADLRIEIKSIAKHLKIMVDDNFINKTAVQLKIESQRKRISKSADASSLITVDHNNRYDPHSLLHLNHIASGEVGRYKKNLSEMQIATITEFSKNWLLSNGYDF